MRRILLPLIAALAVVAGGLIIVEAGPATADRGGCPNPHSSKGAEKANPHSAHGDAKQNERECGGGATQSPVTPAGEPSSTPAPAPSATAAPAATPAPTPTPTPTPEPTQPPSPTLAPGADVKVQGVTVTTPLTATRGVPFTASGAAALHNNGPDGTVNVDVTFTIVLPPDCTITNGSTVVVPNRSLPMSVPVTVSRSWNVTCTQAGAHQFTINASAAISQGQTLTDPNLLNNSGSGNGITTVN